MHDQARSEIARGIYGPPGGTAERQPDAEHEDADEQRLQRAAEHLRQIHLSSLHPPFSIGADGEDAEEQHGCADRFRHEVCGRMSNCRAGGEHRQLRGLVFGRAPMRQIREPHEDGSEKRASDLRCHISRDISPRETADRRERDRDRGVEYCARADAAD